MDRESGARACAIPDDPSPFGDKGAAGVIGGYLWISGNQVHQISSRGQVGAWPRMWLLVSRPAVVIGTKSYRSPTLTLWRCYLPRASVTRVMTFYPLLRHSLLIEAYEPNFSDALSAGPREASDLKWPKWIEIQIKGSRQFANSVLLCCLGGQVLWH